MAKRGSSASVKAAEHKRDSEIAELVCSGRTYADVGKMYGLTSGRISQIVAKCREEWRARRDVATDDHIAVNLLRLDQIYQQAVEGWERSYQDAVTVVTKKSPQRPLSKKTLDKARKAVGKLSLSSQEETRKGQSGDPAFLYVMKSVTETKLKLLNAFPKEDKTEVTNVVQINWGELGQPIRCEAPLEVTPSSEVEARIAAEANQVPIPNNSNGNGHAH